MKSKKKIVVLDTGSNDGTYEKLQSDNRIYKVEQKIITPWRFDTARNESMKLIPDDTDICVVADLDQVFRPGWGDELRKAFDDGYEQVHGDVIYYDENGEEATRILSNQVHSNSSDWHWVRPVHEYITCGRNDVNSVVSSNFVIEHHQDTSKSRYNYLELVEAEYKKNQSDITCAIYYGLELSNYERYDEALEVFLKADEEPGSDDQRLKYLIKFNVSTLYNLRGEYECALLYAYGAYCILKNRRSYVLLADIYHNMNSKDLEIQNLIKALDVKEQYKS